MCRNRRGSVLLEAIVALSLLGIGGFAMVAAVTQAGDAVGRAHTAERRVVSASEFLDAVSLWPRVDLDRHLGTSPQGDWELVVSRDAPELYAVTLLEAASGDVLLRTVVYRPEVTDAAR